MDYLEAAVAKALAALEAGDDPSKVQAELSLAEARVAAKEANSRQHERLRERLSNYREYGDPDK